ncbi:MAG: fumarylacetoacetate hydrolase family protein [Pseudomonadota bacterium]|nr:fumarylacetoacetate hydrolase family protein [Pseudomonadota bacterium]
MKLLRYGPQGEERPGVIDATGRIRDLSGVIEDITPAELSDAAIAKLRQVDVQSLPEVTGTPRLGVPIAGIRQVLAIGLNYKQHAAESNMAIPAEPVVFFKAITSLSGPNDDIVMPGNSEATDWEIELAIVIGKTAQAVTEANAFEYVAGYSIANDVSEREWQLNRSGQWSKGKSFDTFCPLGPWLVTRDEVSDPQSLSLELTVNGEPRQSSNTSDMIFSVRQIIAYCSKFMTLLPGDVVITGTPQGVGWGMKPRKMLKAGDRVRLVIAGLGVQEQTVTAGPPV